LKNDLIENKKHIEGKIFLIYIEGIAVKIERIKKKLNNAMTCKVL